MADRPALGIAIAKSVEGDVEGIIDLFEAVAAEGRSIGIELPIDRLARRATLVSTMREGDGLSLVARAGDGRTIVGQASIVPRATGLVYLAILVSREYRSLGVGSLLLTRLIEGAGGLGAHKIALEVFAHNTRAIALYERFGFVREGLFRAHVRRRSGELWDLVPMGLLLSPP